MEFIKIAYCVTVPLLLIFTLFRHPFLKKYSTRLLAVSNILLIGNSVFFARQLIGAYQLMRSFNVDYSHIFSEEDGLMVRMLLIIFLPLLMLHRYFRKTRLFSVLLAALLYSVFPFSSWNLYDLGFKILAYICMLCSGYALLWLLNKLPDQSPVV